MDNIKDDILNQQQTEQTETSPQDQTELINSLLNKNKEKSNNLIGQREVIKDFNKEKSELKKQVELLQQEIEYLKNQQAQFQQVNPVQVNNEFHNKLFEIENKVRNIEEEKQKVNISKVMNLMDEFGVHPTERKTLYNTMEQRWKINLANDPSLDLVANFLGSLNYSKQKTIQTPNIIPTNINHIQTNPFVNDAEMIEAQKLQSTIARYQQEALRKKEEWLRKRGKKT